jgi:hypothetical protein
MWLSPKLFFYFYLPEACLLYLVAWWIYRRNLAQKLPGLVSTEQKNRYARLRTLALHGKCSPTSKPERY